MNLFNRNFQIMDISVVIPLYNEDESLPELTAWIERVMAANHFTYEIIMVDDGSSDNSWALIETLSTQNEHIRAIKFRRNYGKSAALHCGFQNAQGDVVITMDADMQDSPDEIPALYQMIMSEDYDMISGWKKSSTLSVTRSFFRRWPLIAVLSRATTASPVIFRSTLSPKMAGKESLTVYHIF